MKKTLRKITTVLLVLMLTAGLIASAMADTIYMTEGFVIPAERVGGARLDAQEPDAPAETPPDAAPNSGTEATVETQATSKALDENVEGLVVVEGEEKSEDVNITEQTEVRTNEAETDMGSEEMTIENKVVETSDEDPDITVDQNNKTEQFELLEANDVVYLEDNEGNAVLDENGNPISFVPIENDVVEAEVKITYKKDENGQLILDGAGEPIPIVPEGMEIPVRFKKDPKGVLVLDEYGDPIVLETIAYGSQKMVDLEDLLDPNRSVSVYINYGQKAFASLGDTIQFIAVLKGYDNAVYNLQWQYSLDMENWVDYPDGTEKTLYVTLDETNCQNWWRVHVDVTDVISE